MSTSSPYSTTARSATQRALNITQPAISKSIQALEQSAGAPLFVRSKKGVLPTHFGRTLETRARIVVGEIERAHHEMALLLGLERGRVAVGTTPLFAYLAVTRAIRDFRSKHPGICISVFEGVVDDLIALLQSGELDFVLCSHSPRLQAFPNLTLDQILPSRHGVIVASANHPLATQRHISAKDLAEAAWLLPARSTNYRPTVEDLFRNAGVPPPKAAVEYGSLAMGIQLLTEGNYVTLFSYALVRREIEQDVVRILPTPELRWEYAAGAVYRHDVPLTPAALGFLEAIRQACADHASVDQRRRAK